MALSEAPPFWWKKPGLRAWALAPLAFIYGKISARRMDAKPATKLTIPVVCVGNFVAGGAGKSPTVMALAAKAIAMGLKPGILSRGHGGGLSGANLVDLDKHDSRDVGDEPLLLAKVAPTVISADRPAGANLLIEHGCNIIFMDDGFQNPSLHKDFSLLVVDAKRGIGNGFTHPAGPLRVPVERQTPHANALLVIGEGSGANNIIRRMAQNAKPIQTAKTVIRDNAQLRGKWLLAYAGIADPDKFFNSLLAAGAELIDRRSFGDHHHFHADEIKELLAKAELQNLQLVSTSKDIARLNGLGDLPQKLVDQTKVIEIDLVFDDPGFAERIINSAIRAVNERVK